MRRRAHQGGTAERKTMITRAHRLPIARQCRTLQRARSTAYDQPRPVSDLDLALMRPASTTGTSTTRLPVPGCCETCSRVECPNWGARTCPPSWRAWAIEELYRKPNTSKRHPAHPVHPYLLRNLTITRSNHVWAVDITDIPM